MPSGECSIEPWVFMNWRRAAYYLYLAEVIDAKKALEVGLVNEVVPRDQLDDRVEAIARHIAQAPMTTLLATKANLKRAWELMGMRVHWQSSNDLVALASISKDVQELIQTVFKDKVLPSEQARRQAAAAAASTDGAPTTLGFRGPAGEHRRPRAPRPRSRRPSSSRTATRSRTASCTPEANGSPRCCTMPGCAVATAWPWSCRTGPSSSKSPGAASFPGSTTPRSTPTSPPTKSPTSSTTPTRRRSLSTPR